MATETKPRYKPGLPYPRSYSADEVLNIDTERYDWRKLKVKCPKCERKFAALYSSLTEKIRSGWEWVGASHRRPTTQYRTTCGKCRQEFDFHVYIPQ